MDLVSNIGRWVMYFDPIGVGCDKDSIEVAALGQIDKDQAGGNSVEETRWRTKSFGASTASDAGGA